MDRFAFGRPMVRRALAATTLLMTTAGVAAAGPLTGTLTQLPGSTGCTSQFVNLDECAIGTPLKLPAGVALSPNGRNVYVPSADDDGIAVFTRDAASGALTQPAGTNACVTETGNNGACAGGFGLGGATHIAISPDGKSAYVAAPNDHAVGVFARDPQSGVLSQPGGVAPCVSQSGGFVCGKAAGLDQPIDVAVSPDGNNVYVASLSFGSLVVFARDAQTGGLTQLAGTAGCFSTFGSNGACAAQPLLGAVTSVVVSPNGKHVYVGAGGGAYATVLGYARDAQSGALTPLPGPSGCVSDTGNNGACQIGRGVGGEGLLAFGGDGRQLYVASYVGDSVATFVRNQVTGALTQVAGQAGCISASGNGGSCGVDPMLGNPEPPAVSPDGHTVYVPNFGSGAIAILDRNAHGVLTPHAGVAGCVAEHDGPLACQPGRALTNPLAIAMPKTGKHVYVASWGFFQNGVASFARHN